MRKNQNQTFMGKKKKNHLKFSKFGGLNLNDSDRVTN